MEKKNIDCLVVTTEENIAYLTGYRGPGALIVPKNDRPLLLVPLLEAYRASDIVKGEIEIIAYTEYSFPPSTYGTIRKGRFREVLTSLINEFNMKKVGVDLKSAKHDLVNYIREHINASIIDISTEIESARMIKSVEEIEFIRNAVRIAEKGLKKCVESLREGMSEIDLVRIAEYGMREAGAEGYAFPTIVASGPNAAYPHATPTRRRIKRNEPIIVDLGALFKNYCSDLTRTLFVGNIPNDIKKVLEAVIEAQEEAIDCIEPGIRACDVDEKARKILTKYGLDKHYIHSTGHGIGIEVHESPTLNVSDTTILKEGMVITVEPGVYIWRRYGIRIEDDVLVTKSGREVLSSFAKVIEV